MQIFPSLTIIIIVIMENTKNSTNDTINNSPNDNQLFILLYYIDSYIDNYINKYSIINMIKFQFFNTIINSYNKLINTYI